MTMRATRDALRHGESFARACQTWPTTPWERQHYFDSLATFPAALAEVEAVEAVVEAARGMLPINVVYSGNELRLRQALARLDALTDGQAEGVEPGSQETSGVTSTAVVDVNPVPPSACPCDGTDCVC